MLSSRAPFSGSDMKKEETCYYCSCEQIYGHLPSDAANYDVRWNAYGQVELKNPGMAEPLWFLSNLCKRHGTVLMMKKLFRALKAGQL